MHIIQINASYKPAFIYGGPTMSVSKLCEELIKAGEDIEVFTTTANGDSELNIKAGKKTVIDGVPVTYFRRLTKDPSHFSPALLLHLFNTLKVTKKLGAEKRLTLATCLHDYPIVHIHAWWNLVSIGSCVIALFLSCKVIFSPRGTLSSYSFGNRKSLLKKLFHQIIGKALLEHCHFHVSSEKEKQDILSLIHPKTIAVIPNFVALPHLIYNGVSGCQSNPLMLFKLLFLSRIEEKKGLDILFGALTELTIPYQLTIAGTGNTSYIRYLKSLAIELKISERITWIGQQNIDEKFAVLACHDLMILPSHDESFANVVVESLSVGLPVLISSKVGLASYVLKTNFGWVFQHLNEKHLRMTIEKAYKNSTHRLLIKREAPLQIRKDYDESFLLNNYMLLYKTFRSPAKSI